ncbi:MAG: hypothetical protein SWE60_17530 [Thermodesulfobacteriota bacterium]|nr:hypothetical protein [Thermodesulfobacteriota bacterium]
MTTLARKKRRRDVILGVLTLSIFAFSCFLIEYISRAIRQDREGVYESKTVSLTDIPPLEYDTGTRGVANQFVSHLNRADLHSIHNMFSSEAKRHLTLTELDRIIKSARSEFGHIDGLERLEKPPPDMPPDHSQNHFFYLQSRLDVWKWGLRQHFKVRMWTVRCKEKGVYLLLIFSGNIGDLKIVQFQIDDVTFCGKRYL